MGAVIYLIFILVILDCMYTTGGVFKNYLVKVAIDDHKWAGSYTGLYLTLEGRHITGPERTFMPPGTFVEEGKLYLGVFCDHVDVGAVLVLHARMDSGDKLRIDQITITDGMTGEEFVFKCGRYMSTEVFEAPSTRTLSRSGYTEGRKLKAASLGHYFCQNDAAQPTYPTGCDASACAYNCLRVRDCQGFAMNLTSSNGCQCILLICGFYGNTDMHMIRC